jgi:signal transduction histidine kinase/CheY-like chemotaxis protein
MTEEIEEPDFELRSVVRAYRTPVGPALCITALHAAVLYLLGHPGVAVVWLLAVIPVDGLAYANVIALLKRERLQVADVEVRLACFIFIRFMAIMGGPAAACFIRPAPPELIFLLLSTAIVATAAVSASGYRITLILAGFVPALLGMVLGLSRFWGSPSEVAIAAAVLINVLMMGAILRGAIIFSHARDKLTLARRKGVVDLVAARDRLEDEVEAKSVFLSTLSHEVRTPLNGVMGVAEVLAHSELKPDQRELVETILASGVMMRTILDDVLDAAKIEAGRMELSPSATDLQQLLSQIARVWRAPAQLKGIGFDTHFDFHPTLFAIDAVRLQQVANNLLSNAIKFTKSGGVRLSATLSDTAPHRLRVEVTDTGIGLTAEACEKLFGRFVQADATVAGRFGGSGVGLYVSKNLINLMGGQIGVESTPNQGSTFWFEIAIELAQPVDVEDIQTPSSEARLNILAVDDNPTNRKVVSLLLDMLGHTCETADSGQAALDRLQTQPFDVVLLDLRMPGRDGYETLNCLRATVGPNRDCPVLALTADASDWTDEVAIALGFNGFVSKPIEVPKLAAALATIIHMENDTVTLNGCAARR